MDRKSRISNEPVRRLKQATGENLRAVVFYGSAVGHDFREQSDLNFLVPALLQRLEGADLESLRPVGLWWWHKGHPPPLVFTLPELRSSADVFSIELSDMKARHRMCWRVRISSSSCKCKRWPSYKFVVVERELRTLT